MLLYVSWITPSWASLLSDTNAIFFAFFLLVPNFNMAGQLPAASTCRPRIADGYGCNGCYVH